MSKVHTTSDLSRLAVINVFPFKRKAVIPLVWYFTVEISKPVFAFQIFTVSSAEPDTITLSSICKQETISLWAVQDFMVSKV